MDDVSLPRWVPEGVRDIASGPIGRRGIGLRLLSDPQMEGVWGALMSGSKGRPPPKIVEAGIAGLPPRYRGAHDTRLDLADRAAAAMFMICIDELSNIFNMSQTARNTFVDSWKNAEQACRDAMFISYAGHEIPTLRSFHPSRIRELYAALEQSADYFKFLQENFQASGPRWGGYEKQGETRTGLQVRAQVTAVIDAADKLYEPPLRTPLATMASVSLETTITVRQITNWRALGKRTKGDKSSRKI